MAAPTFCDYQVLSDSSFTLDAATNDNEKTLNFSVPLDFTHGTGVSRPILAFKVAPIQDCLIKFWLNFREIAIFDLDRSHTRGMWEAFSAETAFPDGSSFSNPVPLRIMVTSGKARLEDVVIWYQRRA